MCNCKTWWCSRRLNKEHLAHMIQCGNCRVYWNSTSKENIVEGSMHHYIYIQCNVTRFNMPLSFRSTRSDLNTLIFTLSALRVTDHSLLLCSLPSLCHSFLPVSFSAIIKFVHQIWEKQIFREEERRVEGKRGKWRDGRRNRSVRTYWVESKPADWDQMMTWVYLEGKSIIGHRNKDRAHSNHYDFLFLRQKITQKHDENCVRENI